MNESTSQTGLPKRRGIIHTVLREALFVALAGVAFAIAANELSPFGLSLTRNYFPVAAGTNLTIVRAVAATVTNQPPAEHLRDELSAAGLQLAVSNQVIAWFADPRRLTGHIVFIDARNEADYGQGHVPGAWLFDPYQPEKYFPAVVPPAQAADIIVVYCHGGDCDDSLSAATLLRQVGISGEKISVYGGGFGEWETLGRPVESGPQNSGQINKGGP